jgi:myo-inositol-1-phosphate synthase
MRKKIKVAIAGVGNCASALIQGIQYYNSNPNPYSDIIKNNTDGKDHEKPFLLLQIMQLK